MIERDVYIQCPSTVSYHVVVEQPQTEAQGKPIVFLHGFSQDLKTWKALDLPTTTAVKIDLVGHGKTGAPKDLAAYSVDAICEDIHFIMGDLGIKSYALCGYSYGGRLALQYGKRYGSEVTSLILEGAGLGIVDEEEREQRRISDEQLAKDIELKGPAWFAVLWAKQPIFASQQKQPVEKKRELFIQRSQCNPVGLANTLRATGQGVFPVFTDEDIASLPMPVIYVYGSLDDTKFARFGERIAEKANMGGTFTIEGCGHCAHWEDPEQFSSLLGSLSTTRVN